MASISPLLDRLRLLTEESGRLAQRTRGESLVRELKSDVSIVTNADRAVETFLREELPRLVPGSAVWGEEFGFEEEGAGGLWVVDPVDGTSNFAFGSPLWGVSIGLVSGDDILLGAIALPDLGEVYVAEKGQGALVNGEALSPIPPGAVRPEELVSHCDGLIRRFPTARIPGKMRCAGAFVIDGTFTARQRYRGLIGHKEKLYDIAASVLIGQELGADIRYADGEPMRISEIAKDEQITRPWLMFPRDSGFFLRSE